MWLNVIIPLYIEIRFKSDILLSIICLYRRRFGRENREIYRDLFLVLTEPHFPIFEPFVERIFGPYDYEFITISYSEKLVRRTMDRYHEDRLLTNDAVYTYLHSLKRAIQILVIDHELRRHTPRILKSALPLTNDLLWEAVKSSCYGNSISKWYLGDAMLERLQQEVQKWRGPLYGLEGYGATSVKQLTGRVNCPRSLVSLTKNLLAFVVAKNSPPPGALKLHFTMRVYQLPMPTQFMREISVPVHPAVKRAVMYQEIVLLLAREMVHVWNTLDDVINKLVAKSKCLFIDKHRDKSDVHMMWDLAKRSSALWFPLRRRNQQFPVPTPNVYPYLEQGKVWYDEWDSS